MFTIRYRNVPVCSGVHGVSSCSGISYSIRSEASRASICSGVVAARATAILLALELGPKVDFRFGGICSDYTRTYT